MIDLFLDNILATAPIVAAIVSLVATVTTAALILFYLKRTSGYNEDLRKAELSYMRSALEAEIARLSHELVATKDRFLEVNHLVLSGQNRVKPVRGAVEHNTFLEQFGVTESDLVVDSKLVFVLTPFNSEEDETFRAIALVCREQGFHAVRGDEERVQGDILTHIVKQICKARLVVANVGSRNPNVFYELGIAQALGKQTVLVAEHKADVPFDLQSMRIVLFENVQRLEQLLPNVILRVLAG